MLNRMIRIAGVLALCLTLMVLATACESTGANGGDDSQTASMKCPCGQPGDANITAMVDGKKTCFCCTGCRDKMAKN